MPTANIKDLMSDDETLDDGTIAKILTIVNLIKPGAATLPAVETQYRESLQHIRTLRQIES
jgi:hypothetical protein